MGRENINDSSHWFSSWFDSPYYPMLYHHRNEEEAREFIRRLHEFLELPHGAEVLDLCCGSGRHSRTLGQLGYRVTGIDLSPSSIAIAKELSQPPQQYEVQDMRSFKLNKSFSAVFNLFTSFGYFTDRTDNLRVLKCIAMHIKPEGLLVIDYLNAYPLLDLSKQVNEYQFDGVSFHTSKFRSDGFIVKEIEVKDGDRVIHFREQVQLLLPSDFSVLLEEVGFEVVNTFGNYLLEEYSSEISERCIIIARKS